MKIAELRNRLSNLARNQMSAEQHNQSLQELVQSLAQLETDLQKEAIQLRRRFRQLCLALMAGLLMLSLMCSFLYWRGHRLRQGLEQARVQLYQQQERLGLHEDALLKILKRTTGREPTARP